MPTEGTTTSPSRLDVTKPIQELKIRFRPNWVRWRVSPTDADCRKQASGQPMTSPKPACKGTIFQRRKPKSFACDICNSSELLTPMPGIAGRGRKADEPLFRSAEGKRLHPDNFVKRKLSPLVKLGLAGGLGALRHANATAQARLNTPMKLRQQRLRHLEQATAMSNTQMVGDDDRKSGRATGRAVLSNRKTAQNLPLPKMKLF